MTTPDRRGDRAVAVTLAALIICAAIGTAFGVTGAVVVLILGLLTGQIWHAS